MPLETGGVKLSPIKDTMRMKPYQVVFVIVFFLSLVGIFIWQNFFWPKAVISLKGEEIKVFVASTPKRQLNGLRGRKNLGEYGGMLFVYGSSQRLGVTMSDMKFAIDIVWFSNGEVIDFASNVPATPNVAEEDLYVYFPRVNANVFLELPAGWAESHDLKIGDRLEVINSD